MRSINEIAADIAFTSESKGFHITVDEVDRKLLLAVSEICEAQDQLRDGHGLTQIYYSTNAGYGDDRMHGDSKPEGFPVECADAIIRLLHLMHWAGIDINEVIEQKIAYNKTRPPKHGRQF